MKKGPDNVQNKINKETEQAGEWKELTDDPKIPEASSEARERSWTNLQTQTQ